MLTLVEAISLAGDRAKQNDDVAGVSATLAWVIDGATDLHDAPLTPAASDAAWIAQHLSTSLQCAAPDATATELALRAVIRNAARDAAAAFPGMAAERWKSPTASALIARETPDGVFGLDLGDCRCFAVDADGVCHAVGGPARAADDEGQRARDAAVKAGETPLLRHADTMQMLREVRTRHNQAGGYWVFGLQEECADHARAWTLALKRPAHIVLATDGFAALVDRYNALDVRGLVEAALKLGLAQLGLDLRAIESADAKGERHPRFKASDDATALLLRLS